MAESFSREKLRHAPQKKGGWEILCDLPPVWPRLVRPTNLMSRMNGKKTHTHTRCVYDLLYSTMSSFFLYSSTVVALIRVNIKNSTPSSAIVARYDNREARDRELWSLFSVFLMMMLLLTVQQNDFSVELTGNRTGSAAFDLYAGEYRFLCC